MILMLYLRGYKKGWTKIKHSPDRKRIIITGYLHNSFAEFIVTQTEPEKKKDSIITGFNFKKEIFNEKKELPFFKSHNTGYPYFSSRTGGVLCTEGSYS